MTRIFVLLLGLVTVPLAVAGDVDGLVKKSSPYSVSETLDRLEKVLGDKGITVALRWNHGENAANVDIEMRETEVLIFGNPKLGSHLMTSAQTSGIDLPMKALAWKDANGDVWLAYNDPTSIAKRHGIGDREEVLQKMSGALDRGCPSQRTHSEKRRVDMTNGEERLRAQDFPQFGGHNTQLALRRWSPMFASRLN